MTFYLFCVTHRAVIPEEGKFDKSIEQEKKGEMIVKKRTMLTLRALHGGSIPTANQPPATAGKPIAEIPTFIPIIVTDRYWDSATFIHLQDGTRVDGAIAFSNIPIGAKIYTPISGYVHVMSSTVKSTGDQQMAIFVGEARKWPKSGPVGRLIALYAKKFNLLVPVSAGQQTMRPPFVKRGTVLASITDNSELYPPGDAFQERMELILAFDEKWMETLAVSINDPREYARIAFGL